MSASSKNESSVDKPLGKEEEEDLQQVMRKTFHSAIRSRFEFYIGVDIVGNKIKTKICSRINLTSSLRAVDLLKKEFIARSVSSFTLISDDNVLYV